MGWVNFISVVLTLTVVGNAAGCGDDNTSDSDAGSERDGSADGGGLCALPGSPMPGSCTALPSDYSPGIDDEWPACVADSGPYVPIQATISTVARVAAFEEIAALLFEATRNPSSDDFLAARVIYQEDEGLDSRVARRFDPHFVVPEGTDCTMAGIPVTFPDYCVGPAILQPILLDALNAGIMGIEPRVSAARVEAALLWFLYASTAKESLTCTTTAKDCDSAYAYYTGGEDARCGVGLARYVNAVDPYAHDRAWDGVLALRCWRDLDPAEVATDLARRDLARAQLDRAILHGVAAIVLEGLSRTDMTAGDEQAYHWAFVGVLGRALDRAMQEASPGDAMSLRNQLAQADPRAADIAAAEAAIEAVFACP